MANGANGSMTRTPMVSTSGQQFVIALTILAITVGVLVVLSFVPVPKENQTVLNVVVGNIMGFVAATMAFYFPSSVGGRAKDEAINKLTDQLTPSAAHTDPAAPQTPAETV